MTSRGRKQGGKREKPRSRDEGATRVGSYLHYLYGWEAKPEDLAPVALDAALAQIAKVTDPAKRLALYREAMDRAYAAMAET
jgi:hypothetical protein